MKDVKDEDLPTHDERVASTRPPPWTVLATPGSQHGSHAWRRRSDVDRGYVGTSGGHGGLKRNKGHEEVVGVHLEVVGVPNGFNKSSYTSDHPFEVSIIYETRLQFI